ncbi:MAG TPA: hypothetical protein VHL10_05235 [Nitrososphaera sp.]|jgi:hypothetical protein|nr:hypothetical protein [Nitrososphaera sp.]
MGQEDTQFTRAAQWFYNRLPWDDITIANCSEDWQEHWKQTIAANLHTFAKHVVCEVEIEICSHYDMPSREEIMKAIEDMKPCSE